MACFRHAGSPSDRILGLVSASGWLLTGTAIAATPASQGVIRFRVTPKQSQNSLRNKEIIQARPPWPSHSALSTLWHKGHWKIRHLSKAHAHLKQSTAQPCWLGAALNRGEAAAAVTWHQPQADKGLGCLDHEY